MPRRSYFLNADQLLETDRFVLFFEKQVVVRDQQFVWQREQLEPLLTGEFDFLVVEESEETTFIAVNSKQDICPILGAELRSLRSLLFTQSDYAFTVAGKASQVLDWYCSHRYCGSCGRPTTHHESQRAVFCSNCNQHYFPRINPCAIVLVVRGEQLLLARSARFKTGFFSCLAGFVEIGETPEETVLREVKEEVGIEVENIRYIRSQSWPFPSQLMLGFIAEYRSGEIIPDPEEIAEASWYSIDELPTVPAADISVAGELIQLFIDEARSRSL